MAEIMNPHGDSYDGSELTPMTPRMDNRNSYLGPLSTTIIARPTSKRKSIIKMVVPTIETALVTATTSINQH